MFLVVSCNNATVPQDNNDPSVTDNDNIDNIENAVVDDAVLLPSKFADYLTSVVSTPLPDDAVYYLEKAVTVNGETTSVITAVKNGTVLNITEYAGTKSAVIISRDTVTTLDVAAQTYSQTTCDEASYNAVMASLQCPSKYYNIEFSPSAYTVVDKDQYAEVAMIDDTPHIFIFDDDYNLKYIIYAQIDGSLVTEEIFTFTSEVDDGLFVIPENYVNV